MGLIISGNLALITSLVVLLSCGNHFITTWINLLFNAMSCQRAYNYIIFKIDRFFRGLIQAQATMCIDSTLSNDSSL